MILYVGQRVYCAVPENIDTPPTKDIEFPGGGGVVGVSVRPKT